MIEYARIEALVLAAVLERPKKLAICPMAESGIMAKQILNWRYGVKEDYVIDNKLAKFNPEIIGVEALSEKDTEGLIVLLLIENVEIEKTLYNQLHMIDPLIKIMTMGKPAESDVPWKKTYFNELRGLLRVQHPTEKGQFIRVGKDYAGGYVLWNDFIPDMSLYSFGIETDVSFEKFFADMGVQCYMYDHTIKALPSNHENFHWDGNGISWKDEPENKKKSLGTLIHEHNDDGNRNLILKMDVEGAEWDVILHTPADIWKQFKQMTFELHNITNVDDSTRIITALNKLNDTHQIVWVHGNNYGRVERADDLVIPVCLELTYLRRGSYETEKSESIFPMECDMPCDPRIEEIQLGDWG